MDLPADPRPVGEGGSLRSCNLCDAELVHQIAKLLFRGLSAACVHNTTGIAKDPIDVAVDMRTEMVDHLTQRSKTYLAESAAQGDGNLDPMEGTSKDPTEIISDFINDFTDSKMSPYSRALGPLMSPSQEFKINLFIQVMETDGFWLMNGREAIAKTLLRILDFRNMFHCPAQFGTAPQLVEHRSLCRFRPVNCTNRRCTATFSAIHREKHGSVCPFNVLRCRQNCPEFIRRSEMDAHCETVCPMRPVYCPFHKVGCQSAIPWYTLARHCSEFIQPHLLSVLEMAHKQEISVEELKVRVQRLEESLTELLKTLDVQSLTMALKEQEAKTEKLESELSKFQSTIKDQKAKMNNLERELRKVRRSINPA